MTCVRKTNRLTTATPKRAAFTELSAKTLAGEFQKNQDFKNPDAGSNRSTVFFWMKRRAASEHEHFSSRESIRT
jgi:hypothetical protein